MNDAVPVADPARQLFLLQVEDADEFRQLFTEHRWLRIEEAALRWQPQLGEQMPTQAINLRQAQLARGLLIEHVPQSRLELFGIHAGKQVFFAQHAL